MISLLELVERVQQQIIMEMRGKLMEKGRLQGVVDVEELKRFKELLKEYSKFKGTSQTSGILLLEALNYYCQHSEFGDYLKNNKNG